MDPHPPPTLLSVVVCTHNRAAVLPAALDSVLGQSYTAFEVVVVDDGSTDATAEVVAACDDPRVRYVRRENGGLSAARNTGVDHARGRYVVFLDDDDRALPAWLGTLVPLLDDDCVVACCGARITTDDGVVLETRRPGPLGPAFADFTAWFQPGTFVVRRDAYLEVGGFDPEFRHLEHTDFFLRLLPACRERGWGVRSVPEPLVELRVGGDRRTGLATVARLHDAMVRLLDRHGDRLARDPRLLAQFCVIAGVTAAQTDDFRDARRWILRAVRAQPRTTKHWVRLGLASVPPVGRRVWRRRIASPGGLA